MVTLPLNCAKPPITTGLICSLQTHSSKLPCKPSFSISGLFHTPVNQSVAAIIFPDGSEPRLYPLTKRRSEGAIPIVANYRLVDAVVSNCINSNINKIYALTQLNSTYLNAHLSRAYSAAALGKEGFVEVVAAYQSLEDQDWFQGTADAIRRCMWILQEYPVTEFLVLPGHHLYKMDYDKVIEFHRKSNSDITIVGSSATRDLDSGFGILKLNSENEVVGYCVKSQNGSMDFTRVASSREFDDHGFKSIPSMGIYLINRDTMAKLVNEYFPRANDLGSEVIGGAISKGMKVQTYLFDGYWENMRSIEAFYKANMESRKQSDIVYNFYDRDSPVYTMPRCLPPTLVTDAKIMDSVIGDGCELDRCVIKGSVVGMRTRIGNGAVIEDSVIMGSDVYQEADGEGAQVCRRKGPSIPLGIGEKTWIRRAIVDKNVRIGRNVTIMNKENVLEGNREELGYVINGGIVVVVRGAEIPDGSSL